MLCYSPMTNDVFDIIDSMSTNGYNFIAPEITN